MIALIAITAAAAVMLLVYSLIPQSDEIQRRLANFAGDTGPQARHILIFERLFDEAQKSKILQKLQEAGWYTLTPAVFISYKVGAALLGAVLTAVMILFLKADGLLLILAFMLPAGGFIIPSFILDNAIKNRKVEISCAVPDFLDAVSTAVSAGVALNGALLNAVEYIPGPLGAEFKACLADIRMGRARADALNALAHRVNQGDLNQVVTAIVQSERVGGNISQVLEELAAEARNRRFIRAEEIAAVLPLKMTFPMALLLLPALFVMIFTPVIAGMMAGR